MELCRFSQSNRKSKTSCGPTERPRTSSNKPNSRSKTAEERINDQNHVTTPSHMLPNPQMPIKRT